MGAVVFSNSAAVFIKGDIADPVQGIFYGPVPSGNEHETCWISRVRTERSDPVDNLSPCFAAGEFLCGSLYAEDLADVGKIKIVVEGGAGPDAPAFQAAVALFNEMVLRGEKR